MRNIIIILLALTIFNGNLYAQAKPKRDLSKDKTEVKVRKKAKKKVAQAPKQVKETAVTAPVKKVTAKVQKAPTPKLATYLQVNQSTSVSKTFNSDSGSETFTVKTDGKKWAVNYLPQWCSVVEKTNSFVLKYDKNSTHDDRNDWFIVKSDGKEVYVKIKQLGTPINAEACFDYGSLEHNVYKYAQKNEKYLKINAVVKIKGAGGLKCSVITTIKDKSGNKVDAASSDYHYYTSYNGGVYASAEITPKTDNLEIHKVSMYLPNNAIKLEKGKAKLQCQLSVYLNKTATFIDKSIMTINFKAKNKKGQIVTKKRK